MLGGSDTLVYVVLAYIRNSSDEKHFARSSAPDQPCDCLLIGFASKSSIHQSCSVLILTLAIASPASVPLHRLRRSLKPDRPMTSARLEVQSPLKVRVGFVFRLPVATPPSTPITCRRLRRNALQFAFLAGRLEAKRMLLVVRALHPPGCLAFRGASKVGLGHPTFTLARCVASFHCWSFGGHRFAAFDQCTNCPVVARLLLKLNLFRFRPLHCWPSWSL